MSAQRGGPERLLHRFGSGDPAAIPALLERYLDDLLAYVDRHAGPALQGRETPADLVQSVCREVLEDAQRGALEFRGEPQFRQWLYRAALQKVRGKGRFHGAGRRAAGREQSLGQSGDPAAGPGTSRTPSRSAIENEERARFLAALAQLPPPQRQVVEWAHHDGLAHKEIAARLGISEANSRMLLSRALARLSRLATRDQG